MKKRILKLLIVCTLLMCLAGCRESNLDDFEYIEPAKLYEIDLNAEDPSTDEIQFRFNEDGSIATCKYKIDERDILIVYSYEGKNIQLYVFCDDILLNTLTAEAKAEYSSEIGMSSNGGYFIKGFEL